MKRKTVLLALAAILFLVLVVADQFVSGALALQQDLTSADDTGYKLIRWTVDGGGAMLNGYNEYSLGATIGQFDAKVWQGGGYTLLGGFWGGVMAEYRLYLPLVLRN